MPFKNLTRYFYKTTLDPITKQPKQNPDPIKIGLAAISLVIFLLILVFLIAAIGKSLQKSPPRNIPDTNSTSQIEQEQAREKAASEAAQAAKTPQAQLTQAYNEIVGSPDFLKSITFASGLGTVSYTINSNDNKTILTTGYQNFADFADRSFNIPGLENLKLVIYATAIVDSQGQTTSPAMTLQISKEKSDKINWPINKFRYSTYPANLDVNQINPVLEKDYEQLIKDSN